MHSRNKLPVKFLLCPLFWKYLRNLEEGLTTSMRDYLGHRKLKLTLIHFRKIYWLKSIELMKFDIEKGKVKKQLCPYSGTCFKLAAIYQEGVWGSLWVGSLNKSLWHLNMVKELCEWCLEKIWDCTRKLNEYMTPLQTELSMPF